MKGLEGLENESPMRYECAARKHQYFRYDRRRAEEAGKPGEQEQSR